MNLLTSFIFSSLGLQVVSESMRTDIFTQPIRGYKSIGAQYDQLFKPTPKYLKSLLTEQQKSILSIPATPIATDTSPTMEPSNINQVDKFEWYISNYGITIDGQNSFDVAFNISNKEYELSVLNANCSTAVTGAFLRSEYAHRIGDNFKIVTSSFAINQTNIELNEVWTRNNNEGWIDFCIKMTTYSDTDHDILINSLDTVYRIDVDMTSGFEIENINIVGSESADIDMDRKTARDGKGEDIKQEVRVVAFQCDDFYTEVYPPLALKQGDVLQICVKVDDSASLFEIDYVESLNITQSITQSYNDNSPLQLISNGNSYAYKDLTDITCNSDANKICKVDFQLLDSSFELESLPDLGVFGNAKLILRDDSRHLDKSTDILRNDMTFAGMNLGNADTMFGLMVNLSAENSAYARSRYIISYAIFFASGIICAFYFV